MDRVILHCDCNGFYASVEEMQQPALRQVPMAVAGDPDSRHGIILAKNELARRCGVQTAETIWQARRKCPELVCVPPHHELYRDLSRRINTLYLEYTDLVDPFGIDESFLDVTGSPALKRMTPPALADELRRRVRETYGVTISVGVSFCRVLAKLGSDYRKPDATTVIGRPELETLVWPLPVSALLYAGRRTTEALEAMGIRTIGQLAAADRLEVGRRLGKAGDQLWRYANGQDSERVRSWYEPRPLKSVGNGMTFRRDLTGEASLRPAVSALADQVAVRLRAHSVRCTTVQLQIKSPTFRTVQRQQKLAHATWLHRELTETAMALLRAHWSPAAPVRALTITAADLVPAAETAEQADLFEDPAERARREKLSRLEDAVAGIRGRYGRGAISYGPGKQEK